jgi:hypothetical protein
VGHTHLANVDLDEFMVFEQNEEQARSFFRGFLFKHITAAHEGVLDPAIASSRGAPAEWAMREC